MKCFFRFKETNSELFEKGRLVVFTNDFFTVYQDTSTGEMNISLNEIGNFSFYQSALRQIYDDDDDDDTMWKIFSKNSLLALLTNKRLSNEKDFDVRLFVISCRLTDNFVSFAFRLVN